MNNHTANSLSDRVFEKLRDDILNQVYKENDELREIAIGNELGVSRTPVREALRQLELEGLVSIIPNKGAYVTGISDKDAEDIYVIRSMLEGLCARWACDNITKAQKDRLEEIILLAEHYLGKEKEESARQVADLDSEFHEILYEACGSRILGHVLRDFHKYVHMSRLRSVSYRDRASFSVNEHKEILNAIIEKDGAKAERLANMHVLQVMENLRRSL
ncbi:MAG: GntR family transcriptional regulator [Lachnospiraceae bacterium]|jgi:DNA-binding GntR family transcriptional regulator|nr:GntR family transcriptional regulator [Lachnospiraceae bacterium]